MSELRIGSRTVGSGQPVYIVAEIGGNHNGDHATAEALVREAARAGADAVKVQCFDPSAMTIDIDDETHRVVWNGQPTTLWKLYQETAMPLNWHAPLKALAGDIGIDYFGSVFDQAGIDLMVRLGAPALKVASFEITDLALIRACGRTGMPLLLSTGMANTMEVLLAIKAADEGMKDRAWLPQNRAFSNPSPVVVLKCTSAYPAPITDANLLTLQDAHLRAHTATGWYEQYTLYLHGLSDHTRSNAVVSAAVALGACVVERHIRLPGREGPDAAFSDTPDEFAAMVQAIREVESALGTVQYSPTESERPMLRFRRSLWVVRDIAAGETITTDNVRSLRPEGGLAPAELPMVLGRHAAVDISRGVALTRDMVGL